MSDRRPSISTVLMRSLASQVSWCIVFGLFLFESLWVACSARYPMAFDEQFHFGLIQLHAKQWIPFFTTQPPTGAYGAVVRDPSYLYHWLMSFPYRAISLFSHNQTTQVVWLRFINIALFAVALLLYRRILRRFKLSEAFINCALLVFILIPVVPVLAATINYDNLLIVVLPACVLLTLSTLDSLRTHTIPIARLAVLYSLLLLGSLVKYPFLPVPVVTTVFLVWYMGQHGLLTKATWHKAWATCRTAPKYRQVLLVALLVISLGLFCERYAVNLVQYHTPIPACDQVASTNICQQYGPWARDDILKQQKDAAFHPSIATYSGDWLAGMWYRLFFAVGPYPIYDTQPPLIAISCLAIGVAILGALGVIVRAKSLFSGSPERVLLLLLLLGYGLALFGDNYLEYTRTAQVVAVNGRYWIPFLPFFFILAGLAWSSMLRRAYVAKLSATLFVLAVFVLQGGGTMTFIVDSSGGWLWPNATVQQINSDVRSAARPLMWHRKSG